MFIEFHTFDKNDIDADCIEVHTLYIISCVESEWSMAAKEQQNVTMEKVMGEKKKLL